MQAGADHEESEAGSPDPETQDPQPAASSGRKAASEPGQIPELQDAADPELTDQEPESVSEAKSETESQASPAVSSDRSRPIPEELDTKRGAPLQDPIKIQSAQADTGAFRRFLAGLFGAKVEGIAGEVEDPPPTDVTPSDAVIESSTQMTAPGEPALEVHPEEVQPAPELGRESVNDDAASWPRKPPSEDEDWDYTLARKTWASTATRTTRLPASSPNVRARVLSSERILGARQLARRMMGSLQTQRRWATSAMVLLFVAAIPIAFLIVADGDLSSLARFTRQIIPRNPPAIEGNVSTFDPEETPTDDPNAAGLFTLDSTHTPGTDFAGAYVLSVEHLSADESMLQIIVPAGVEGTYQAVVTISEGLEYECVFLNHYTNLLYCIGPLLPELSKINIRIFRIDEVDGTQNLVFETNYSTGEFAPLATPSPFFPIYGGAFTWPDRFDQVEIRREQQSSGMLAPFSAMLSVVLPLMHRLLSRGKVSPVSP